MPTPELKASLHTLILVGKILFDHGSLQTLPETTTQKTKQNKRLKLVSAELFQSINPACPGDRGAGPTAHHREVRPVYAHA